MNVVGLFCRLKRYQCSSSGLFGLSEVSAFQTAAVVFFVALSVADSAIIDRVRTLHIVERKATLSSRGMMVRDRLQFGGVAGCIGNASDKPRERGNGKCWKGDTRLE